MASVDLSPQPLEQTGQGFSGGLREVGDDTALTRLAGALLSVFDWTQLLLCTVQALSTAPGVSARIWALGPTHVTELGRCPADAMMPGQAPSVFQEAGGSLEPMRTADGTVLAPLRSVGTAPMLLELRGLAEDDLAHVDAVTRIVASRAAYLVLVDPDGRVLPAVRGNEEATRAVRGFSTSVQSLLRHDRLTIFLLTAGDRAIERFAVAGAPPMRDEQTITPISEFGLRDSLLHDRALLTGDLVHDRAPYSRGARLLASAGFRSALSVPLRLAGRRIGMLQFLSRSVHFYTEQDIQLAQDVADHAAPFIDHLRRQEAVRPAALREAIETERTRLARDLHTVAHTDLAEALHTAFGAGERTDQSTAEARLARLARLVASAQDGIRAAVADITPAALRSRPFEVVVREALRIHGTEHGLTADLRLSGDPSTTSMTARRMTHGVLCAALATVRAAGGSRVSVSLTVEDDILLNVTDDGLPGQRHLEIEQAAPAELQTIAECAHALGGRLYTEHRPERGTTLVLELPRVQPVRRDLEDERWPAAVPENEPSPSLRVFVLDPHGVRRAGLRHFLDAQDDLRVVGNAATISEARRSIGWLRPDVVFLDAEDETAPAATHEVHQVSPDSIVVGLTSRMGKALDGELLEAGAAGVLPQDLERTELLGAIRRLVRGESPELQTSTAHAVPQGASVLNSREWEVLKLIVEGRTNAEIAAEIYLAPKSIERHVAAVIRKVGARNRAHLVALAIGRGLVRAPLD